jgi:hypothetical protein
MKPSLFMRCTLTVTSLTLITMLPEVSIHTAEQSLGADTSAQELLHTITNGQSSSSAVPIAGSAQAQATWVDDIENALGKHFKAKYPAYNFDSYLKVLTLVRDALGRGDQRTVKVEIGVFFKMLTNRANGISEEAADELSNLVRIAMPAQEYGIIFPVNGAPFRERQRAVGAWFE